MTTIKPEILDELLAGVSSPEELMGDKGLFRQLKKALMERALGGELTHHLGYAKGDPSPPRAPPPPRWPPARTPRSARPPSAPRYRPAAAPDG